MYLWGFYFIFSLIQNKITNTSYFVDHKIYFSKNYPVIFLIIYVLIYYLELFSVFCLSHFYVVFVKYYVSANTFLFI